MAGCPLAPVFDGSGWLLVALMFIKTLPSEVMCGVTSSWSRASTKVVFTPWADTWLKGIDTPWLMLAFWFWRVVTLGALMVFTVPFDSAAESRRFRLTAPLAEPNVKPSAPPAPAPTAAGRLTAKFGAPETPEAEAVPRSEPPVTRTVLGKARPVALPVAGAA